MHKFPVFKKVDDCRSYGARDLCTNALLIHIRPKLSVAHCSSHPKVDLHRRKRTPGDPSDSFPTSIRYIMHAGAVA